MLFDLDRHKVRVAAEVVLTAASGGAIAAVMATVSDPAHFNLTLSGLKDLARVAAGGAFTGVLFLLRSIPRDPTAWQRREDPRQVEKAAEKLGITAPVSARPRHPPTGR